MGNSKISNWGNYPVIEANVSVFNNIEEAKTEVKKFSTGVVRGTGLSYGDASLATQILSTNEFNQIIEFDSSTGIILTEAGVTLDRVLQAVVPQGWFLPVTPGTKFITVGGAVAGDVHGKNHHNEGSFCRHVISLEVLQPNGQQVTCSAEVNTELYKTICGGLGHAALILSVRFKLKKIETAFIRQNKIIVKNLDEMLATLQKFNAATYSVSWIDCLARGKNLGRGVLMLGEHATQIEVKATDYLRVHTKPKFSVPFFFPTFLLNSFTVKSFNLLYFNMHKSATKESVVHYDPYFYPLDFVRNWNKLYGRRGFLQYQFVVPFENAAWGLRTILDKISTSGLASFLAVLKALGDGEHVLSFPMPGFTLALDFPVTDKIFPLLDELDKIVTDLGGRIYLVKDARMKSEIYWQGYSNAEKFKALVTKFDPNHRFASSLSKRLQMI